MWKVDVEVKGNKVNVLCPYNAEFIKVARQLNGKFYKPVWQFDSFLEGRVRQELLRIFGTDGTSTPLKTILLSLDGANPNGSELTVGPIQVLKKWSRDEYPKLGDGCAVVEGGLLQNGGSVKYPQITWKVGTVIRITNVPAKVANEWVADGIAVEEPQHDSQELTAAEECLVRTLKNLAPERLELVLQKVK